MALEDAKIAARLMHEFMKENKLDYFLTQEDY